LRRLRKIVLQRRNFDRHSLDERTLCADGSDRMVTMRKFLIFAAPLMLLPLGSCDSKPKTQQSASAPVSAASPARDETGPGTEHGTIEVHVPAGVVGGDYWIYVDGHLAGGPPHDSIVTQSPDARLVPIATFEGGHFAATNGWDIWGPKGVVLES